ncbi:MAG TPA: methyltransferase [Anaerolineae bacterium]|nr:methyltransferase [Anaerolineae bacterium]
MNKDKNKQKTKIAVLGGGMGALSTLFYLTDPRNPYHDQYDITVFQMGWRLGGKVASGRSLEPEYHYRIEEHGYHMFPGFYNNTFHLIQECFKAMHTHQPPLRQPDAPLGTWQSLFTPDSTGSLIGQYKDLIYELNVQLPTNTQTPGSGDVFLDWISYVEMGYEVFREFLDYLHKEVTLPHELHWLRDASAIHGSKHHPFFAMLKWYKSAPHELLEFADEQLDELLYWQENMSPEHIWSLKQDIACVKGLAEHLWHDAETLIIGIFLWLEATILRIYLILFWDIHGAEIKAGTNEKAFKTWIMINFMYANIQGIYSDHIYRKGFEHINNLDYRAWLKQYMVPDDNIMLSSALLNSAYNAVFGYIDGDTSIPEGEPYAPKAAIEAGTILKNMIRSTFTYKGASLYKINAGTGEAILTPIYLVLRARGVKFKFFHRVRSIHHSDDETKSINRLVIGEQVEVKGEYNPLFDVKGIACWPSTPFYDQLVQGEEIKENCIDLEATKTPWKDVKEHIFSVGDNNADFQKVLLGIPASALSSICPDLIASSPQWQEMLKYVVGTNTQSVQLWLNQTSSSLGRPADKSPGIDYPAPYLNDWADMTALTELEDWPAHSPYPLNRTYLVSVFPNQYSDDQYLPANDPQNKEQCRPAGYDVVKNTTASILNDQIKYIWPLAQSGNNNHFTWSYLYDPRKGKHVAQSRLDSQYIRPNTNLWERYILSIPNSSKHRLQANNPQEFSNLYLCGDWVWTGINAGSMEATIMSGMLASLALSGYPAKNSISGLYFGDPHATEKYKTRITIETTDDDSNEEGLPDVVLPLVNRLFIAQYLLIGENVRLFEILNKGATPAQTVANQIGMPLRTTLILLRALTAAGYLRYSGGRYSNTYLTDQFLSGKPPFDLRTVLRFWQHYKPSLRRQINFILNNPLISYLLSASVKTNSYLWQKLIVAPLSAIEKDILHTDKLTDWAQQFSPEHLWAAFLYTHYVMLPQWGSLEQSLRHDKATFPYSKLTTEQLEIAANWIEIFTAKSVQKLVNYYDFKPHQHVIDLGGGTGSLLIATLQQYSHLHGAIMEVPTIVPITQQRLEDVNMDNDVKIISGDVFNDEIPQGYDVILLANVIHLYSSENNQHLLKRIRQAVDVGARLLLIDFWTDETGLKPLFGVLMAGGFTTITGQGNVYSIQEAHNWLRLSGWKPIKNVALAQESTLIIAEAK